MDYTLCVTDDGRNYAAIEKIIAVSSYNDYRRANPVGKNGKPMYKKYRPYSLSYETREALDIKKKYLSGEISEEQYKRYCLIYNLTTLVR